MGAGANRFLVFVAVAIILVAGAQPETALAGASAHAEHRCDGARVVVRGGDGTDFALVCADARDALGFFAGLDFDTAVGVDIEVARTLPEKAAPSAVGCHAADRKRVDLLSHAGFAARKDWFGLPIVPAMCRSLASHEVALAIAACSCKDARPSLAAVEYVGYAAMLSAMEPGLRQRVPAPFTGDEHDSDEPIDVTIYPVDPMRFGVESCRHVLRQPDKRSLPGLVFAGKRLVD
jgi:hypothetical protein